jgi:hypothetical protein
MKRTLFEALPALQLGSVREFLAGMVLVGALAAPFVVVRLLL